MKAIPIISGIIAILLASISSVSSQELRYLGRDVQDVRKGWIQMEGQYYQVAEGTVISGWGTVSQVTDTYLITEYTLTEPEKDSLRNRGAAVYNALQIKIPHDVLRTVPVPIP